MISLIISFISFILSLAVTIATVMIWLGEMFEHKNHYGTITYSIISIILWVWFFISLSNLIK